MGSGLHPEATPLTAWPIVLRGGDGRARVRPWAPDPSVALLTFIDHGVVPPSTVMRVWLSELRARGFGSVRTGAVTESGADALQRLGFETLQRLRLLDASLVDWHRARDRSIRCHRLRHRQLSAAAAVDHAAFGTFWAIDERGIEETRAATPVHRARGVGGDHLAGYAVSGRADRTGYLQRLAVDPAAQGRGIGTALVVDSLRWMQHHKLTRAVVNTHVDNDVALRLYTRLGFRALPQGLTVLTRRLDDIA